MKSSSSQKRQASCNCMQVLKMAGQTLALICSTEFLVMSLFLPMLTLILICGGLRSAAYG